jgi:hypothetical protein
MYALTLCAVCYTRFFSERTGELGAALIALCSFVLAAARPEHFPDVDTYELMYDFAASGNFSDPLYWAAHGEPGFKILAYTISAIGIGYDGFLLIMAGMSLILLFVISSRSKIPFSYLWFAYFSCFFITRDLGVIRLSIASNILVLFFLEYRLLRQILLLAGASLIFQSFSLIGVVAKFLSRYQVRWTSIIGMFIFSYLVSNVVSFENLRFLIPDAQIRSYEGTNQANAAGSSMLLPVVRNLFFALFLYFMFKKQTTSKTVRLILWAMFLSAAFYILAADIKIVAQRFSAYFGAILPVALAYLMIRKSQKNDQFFLLIVVCLFNFISLFYYNDFLWRISGN